MKRPALQFASILCATVPALVILHYLVPPLEGLGGARVFLLPSLVALVALAWELVPALAFSFYAGFLLDALTLPIVAHHPATEAAGPAGHASVIMPIGWSILAFAALGAIARGFRPLFLRGRWEIHCLLGGACTALYVAAEYLLLTLGHADSARQILPQFGPAALARILGTGGIALLLSPPLYLLVRWIARASGFPLHRQPRHSL